MDITIHPGKLQGDISVIPSKSQAHRYLICSAFADAPTRLICPETNQDIEATVNCLRALGAQITYDSDGYTVIPAKNLPDKAMLPCAQSGTTLRFLLPVVGALGVDGTFLLEGRLPQRPLCALWEEMERMGCSLSRPTENSIRCCGGLKPGTYTIDGSISSQFVSGLLLALSLMERESSLSVTGNVESAPYIALTEDALSAFGADPKRPGLKTLRSPGKVYIEGDWSNGAVFLAANALGSKLCISGLNRNSLQGDRAAETLLDRLKTENMCINAADIPDLVPVLAVVAAAHHGCSFTHIHRLRWKESDRVESTLAMLQALGCQAQADTDTLTIAPAAPVGGRVDSFGDHRIAMAAAVAATVCKTDVTILGAQAVTKSYPRFWEEYSRLGGNYELDLR